VAYIDQSKKQEIAKSLKAVMPKGWKYSLSIHHHSTLILTIASAPVDLCAKIGQREEASTRPSYCGINHHYLERSLNGELLETFKRIMNAMNAGNHDRSDLQSDYFDVGWYIDIQIGRWDRPFKVA
jgi:hypothetical protein